MNFEPKNPNLFQTEGPINQANTTRISIRCPHCRQLGTFGIAREGMAIAYPKREKGLNSQRIMIASVRVCPNPSCAGLVFVIEESGGSVLEIRPPELLDFNPEDLPPILLATLQEAISCHGAGAYRAAAMMVRRLLEEICHLNNAEGNNLHERLEALKTLIVMPTALFDAMSELKALGNDAAHIEAKAYENIGEEEASASIDLAKEILKARYQLQSLVDRLQALKKDPSASAS